MTEDTIISALQERVWKKGAHAWLRHVPPGTGASANTFIDALVVSTWPSRGLWLAGVEVKCHRGDWVREHLDPPALPPLRPRGAAGGGAAGA